MPHYISNVRDLYFNLFEVLDSEKIFGQGVFADIDEEVAKEMVAEVGRLAENELAESLLDSDRNPPVYDPETQEVTIPESFKKSYKAYVDGEWWRLDAPEELGGMVVPPTLRWSIAELVCGSNPAIHMYGSSYSFGRLLYFLGTDEQKKLAKHLIDGGWHATMVLTEPDAGSDVGAGRTKAVQQDDGTWHIEGVKRFITSAESDMVDNVVHFVLARPEGAGPGTKGLSLFIVPKYQVNLDTGDLGERNGAYVTNVEHKMGLKTSTTCEVTFGGDLPAVGTLLGDVHDGIAQMFYVIESARMFVGTKAIATLSTGYLNALAYAKERIQGADMTTPAKDAPRVAITHHPDVRRSLMLQKSYAEGMRSLVLYTAHMQDLVALTQDGNPTKHPESDSEADIYARVNDLLLPVVKGVGSERAWVLLGTESLQTFGGSGFLQDYPIEQYVRDAKIDTLYEGTTAIQGLDFFFRKILKDEGKALTWLQTKIKESIAADGAPELAAVRENLGRSLGDLEGIFTWMTEKAFGALEDARSAYNVGLTSTRALMTAGDVIIGWLLLRGAEVAAQKLASGEAGKDEAFYQGKIAAAQFFASEVLPTTASSRAIVESTTIDLMDLPEAAF